MTDDEEQQLAPGRVDEYLRRVRGPAPPHPSYDYESADGCGSWLVFAFVMVLAILVAWCVGSQMGYPEECVQYHLDCTPIPPW